MLLNAVDSHRSIVSCKHGSKSLVAVSSSSPEQVSIFSTSGARMRAGGKRSAAGTIMRAKAVALLPDIVKFYSRSTVHYEGTWDLKL